MAKAQVSFDSSAFDAPHLGQLFLPCIHPCIEPLTESFHCLNIGEGICGVLAQILLLFLTVRQDKIVCVKLKLSTDLL